MIITGLDLSLTSAGLARIVLDTDASALIRIDLSRVGEDGHRGDTLEQRAGRLRRQATVVLAWALGSDLTLVEAPAYSSSTGSAHDRSGLWWLVIGRLLALGRPVIEIGNGQRAKYGSGVSGNASKDKVLSSMVRRFPDLPIDGNDVADGLAIACMGARWLGYPVDGDVPKPSLAVMADVNWPDRPVSA